MENDNTLYISSGFLYRKHQNFYFVTSLGSVLGKTIPEGYFKLNNKKIPSHFETKFSTFQNDLISINKWNLPVHISIYDEDFEPNFYIHPTYKKEVDIAVFPIDAKGADLIALNDFDTVKSIDKKEVIAVGYPLVPNESDDKTNPVYEISKITHNGTNICVIEHINRIGLFGAAIFKKTDLNENAFSFIGIFSGNHTTNLKKEPIVWKKSFIEEIIQAKYKESCLD